MCACVYVVMLCEPAYGTAGSVVACVFVCAGACVCVCLVCVCVWCVSGVCVCVLCVLCVCVPSCGLYYCN